MKICSVFLMLLTGLSLQAQPITTTPAGSQGRDLPGPATRASIQPVSRALLRVRVRNGLLQGIAERNGVRSFKGIPFAKPPVGERRWREPQPAENWQGVRPASRFSARPMQRAIYRDMIFRNAGGSEDCLYLNVWTAAHSPSARLPVLVYFFGGGFSAGDGSENRYDGASMAARGAITVTVNYRLGIFGFFALHELTRESPHHSAGNYGLMDQHAALVWVQQNIAAFGGDPSRVTIGGESAGASSVCAQMASPLSKNLFIRAIAESGSMLGNRSPVSLDSAERTGRQFADSIQSGSLKKLRTLSAEQLLAASASWHFPVTVDTWFLPESPQAIFQTGRQMDIPLLAGWNSAEVSPKMLLGAAVPSVINYRSALKRIFGSQADAAFAYYPALQDSDVISVATDLASDRFSAYNTWKFTDLHGKTDGQPVYRYLFLRARPGTTGAAHASEIEYALGNLATNTTYAWTADDFTVSEKMQTYFACFIKTGDPNGSGQPHWYGMQSSVPKVMMLDVIPVSRPEKNLNRYQFLDSLYNP